MKNYSGGNTIIALQISFQKQLEFYVELDTTLIRKL